MVTCLCSPTLWWKRSQNLTHEEPKKNTQKKNKWLTKYKTRFGPISVLYRVQPEASCRLCSHGQRRGTVYCAGPLRQWRALQTLAHGMDGNFQNSTESNHRRLQQNKEMRMYRIFSHPRVALEHEIEYPFYVSSWSTWTSREEQHPQTCL